jgi:hypothetical protein
MNQRTAIDCGVLLLLLLGTIIPPCQGSTVTSGRCRRRYWHGWLHPTTPTSTITVQQQSPTDPLAFLLCKQQDSTTKTNTDQYPEGETEDGEETLQQRQQPKKKGSSFWPPWPFNLIQSSTTTTTTTTTESTSPSPSSVSALQTRPSSSSSSSFSMASLLWTFGYQTLQASVRNIQEIGFQLWFHVPPAAPPLIVLASIPQRCGTTTTNSRIIPIWSNPFVRNMVLSSFGLAILSWAHSEWTRRRKLTLLPLSSRYIDMNRVVLPPFLPEAVTTPYFQAIQEQADEDDDDDDEEDENPRDISSSEGPSPKHPRRRKTRAVLPSRLQRHWKLLRGKVPKPKSLASALRDWRNMRQVQKSERKNAHRLLIYDELLAIQTLKKKADRRQEQHHQQQQRNCSKNNPSSASSSVATNTTTTTTTQRTSSNEMGYALVTGASKGIGRAIAVELARWEIPLLLVARDIDALVELACDIEACYGVSCCVLQADLAQPETAQAIYQTVQDAGLKVDVSTGGRV